MLAAVEQEIEIELAGGITLKFLYKREDGATATVTRTLCTPGGEISDTITIEEIEEQQIDLRRVTESFTRLEALPIS